MSGTTINNKLSTRTAGGRSKYGEVIKRIGLAMMGAVVAIGFSLAPVANVFASSDWDTTWRTTSHLWLQSPSCAAVDKTAEISAQLASDTGWPPGGSILIPNNSMREYYHEITSGSSPGFVSIVQTHQVGTDWTWVSIYAQKGTGFTAIWGNDGSNGHYVRIPGVSFDSTSFSGQVLGFMLDDETCDVMFGTVSYAAVAYLSTAGDGSVFSMTNADLFFYGGATLDQNDPDDYEGPDLRSYSDNDGDGLDSSQEFEQGTSDDEVDTDGDGLSDRTESVWNPDRSVTFCKQTSPYACAYPNPIVQDVYVEIDWMDDGITSYKPSSTQLGMVSDAFANKGILFHADTGEYGGGNELSTYEAPLHMEKDGTTDFFDYKSNDFDADHAGIWRYMISGYNFYSSSDPTGSVLSSGGSYAGSDNMFVSNGLIADNQVSFGYSDTDTAIAGTMMHEIGHSLCLSGDLSYSNEDIECVYPGVDSGSVSTDAFTYYVSSMNFYDQMAMVDYSSGVNGFTYDHDDWSAVKNQMGVFTLWDYDTDHDYSSGVSLGHRSMLKIGITTSMAKKLKAKGLLKTGKATWRHLKVTKPLKQHRSVRQN